MLSDLSLVWDAFALAAGLVHRTGLVGQKISSLITWALIVGDALGARHISFARHDRRRRKARAQAMVETADRIDCSTLELEDDQLGRLCGIVGIGDRVQARRIARIDREPFQLVL